MRLGYEIRRRIDEIQYATSFSFFFPPSQYIQAIIYMTFLVPPYRTLFVRKSGNDRCHLPVGTVLLSVRLYSYFFSFVQFKYLSSLGISTLLTFVAIFAYFYLAIQSNLDYPDLDYPDFSIIRTFSLVPIWL